MNIVNVISNCILIISILLVVYMMVNLIHQKRKLNRNEIKVIKNTKYIVIITIILILFLVHGLLRNFV